MWLVASNVVCNDPYLLVFTPLCNPFYLTVG